MLTLKPLVITLSEDGKYQVNISAIDNNGLEQMKSSFLAQNATNETEAEVEAQEFIENLKINFGLVEAIPNLVNYKISSISKIKAQRDSIEASGFEYLGKVYDSDANARDRLTFLILGSLVAGENLPDIPWTLKDGSIQMLTYQEARNMALRIIEFANDLHQKGRVKEEAINSATTIAGVDAVLELGW